MLRVLFIVILLIGEGCASGSLKEKNDQATLESVSYSLERGFPYENLPVKCQSIRRLSMAIPLMRDQGITRKVVLKSMPVDIPQEEIDMIASVIADAYDFRNLNSFTLSLIHEESCMRAEIGLSYKMQLTNYIYGQLVSCQGLNNDKGLCIRKAINGSYKK
ncbi:hypothetical protein [Zooshikella sp. RANM57]|uniref:hypothetical protein n=1 Tax=Zooshikella sp. RANM57 TaxID=3425863 RepID=UPI003D6F35BF